MADTPKTPPPEDLELIADVGYLFNEMDRLGILSIDRTQNGYQMVTQNPDINRVTREHRDYIVAAGEKAKKARS